VIVADTSALLAVVLGEPKAELCSAALSGAESVVLSAGTAAEARIVAMMKEVAPQLERLLGSLPVTVIAVDEPMVALVVSAYHHFGKGRHRAKLNYGDCFSYALAKQLSCPLLFIGNDFSQTDIRSAL
jgi:ribonuclease VapC